MVQLTLDEAMLIVDLLELERKRCDLYSIPHVAYRRSYTQTTLATALAKIMMVEGSLAHADARPVVPPVRD